MMWPARPLSLLDFGACSRVDEFMLAVKSMVSRLLRSRDGVIALPDTVICPTKFLTTMTDIYAETDHTNGLVRCTKFNLFIV